MKRNLLLTLMAVAALTFVDVQPTQAQVKTIVRMPSMPSMPVPKYTERQRDSIELATIEKISKILRGVVLDSTTKEPIQSAVVYLMGASIYGRNIITKSTVTDQKGRFEISIPGESKIEVSCLGYKIYTQKISVPKYGSYDVDPVTGKIIREAMDIGKIYLAPDPFKADEAVIKSRLQMYEQRGDTTRIFPKLAKTMEGDALIEVIKQIPGFKVEDDGTIYENGRRIERTYVNNTLLFGTDPRTAFLKLTAQSALAIDTYEEKVDKTEAALTNRATSETTRRVANITTTRKIKEYITMEWLAESGVDHDKDIDGSRNVRYGLLGDIGSYKVGQQLSLRAEHSTMAVRDVLGVTFCENGNPRNTRIDIRGRKELSDTIEIGDKKMPRKFGDISGSYSFNNSRRTNQSRSTSTYFPTANFDSQIIESINDSKSKTQRHSANFDYISVHKFPFTFMISPTFSKSEKFSDSKNITTTDGSLLSKVSQDNQNESKNFSINSSISTTQLLLKDKTVFDTTISKYAPSQSLSLNLSANVQYDNNKGDGLRNYELTDREGTNLTTLTTDSDLPSLNASVNGHLDFNRSQLFEDKNKSSYNKMSRFNVRLNLSYRYNKSKEFTVAMNQATGEIDEAYSGDFIRNNRVTTTGLEIQKLWKSGLSLTAEAKFSNNIVKSDEKVPNVAHIDRTFNEMNYQAMLRYNYIQLSFNTSSTIPYANQLSDFLNSDDPMSLSAGNPNLKSSKRYNVALSISNRSFTTQRRVNINSRVSFSLNTDPVTMIRRYFTESTILPEYGHYEAAAGATLNTPMNVGNNIYASASLEVGYRIQKYNTLLSISARGGYGNPYTSIDDELIRSKTSSTSWRFSINSTPTRKVRIEIDNNTSFSWQKNDKYDYRSRTNDLNAKVRIDFLNRMTFTPSYTNTFQKAYTTGQTIERNALNLSFGARMLKKRNGLLSINVYNIFNDNPAYELNTTNQYIAEAWRQQFARFYSISFQYKFNSLDHTKNK